MIEQNRIVEIVDVIIAKKQEKPSADTSELERQIDRFVYELYGLSEEEFQVLEG
jgi:hypothetical protein